MDRNCATVVAALIGMLCQHIHIVLIYQLQNICLAAEYWRFIEISSPSQFDIAIYIFCFIALFLRNALYGMSSRGPEQASGSIFLSHPPYHLLRRRLLSPIIAYFLHNPSMCFWPVYFYTSQMVSRRVVQWQQFSYIGDYSTPVLLFSTAAYLPPIYFYTSQMVSRMFRPTHTRLHT